MVLTSSRFLWLLIKSFSISRFDTKNIIRLKITIKICKVVVKFPQLELRYAKPIIIKADLRNT